MKKSFFINVVRVEIHDNEPKPHLPEKDLISQLFDFLVKEKIEKACSGGISDSNLFVGYYSEKDANCIKEWLKKKNIEVESKKM